MTQYRYTFGGECSINGIRRSLLGATITYSTDAMIATAQFQLDPFEGIPYPRDEVIAKIGHNGQRPIVFVGFVGDDSLAFFPKTGQISARGPLAQAEKPIGLPAGETLVDEDGNPIAVASWGLSSPLAVAMTDGAIVKAILDLWGIAYDSGDWAEQGWTLGDVKPVDLNRGQSGLELIKLIDKDAHCATYDRPDGRVGRVRLTTKAVGNPTAVYREGFDIERVDRRISDRQVVNRINVTGLDNGIFQVSDTVQADAALSPTTGKSLVPMPPGYASEDHQSDLLETAENCTIYGAAELGERNRLVETVDLKLPIGQTHLLPGSSVQVFAAGVGLGTGVVQVVTTVTHRLSATAFKTDLQLASSAISQGVSANKKPLAVFSYTVIKERLANGTGLYVIVCDATGSTDPDGSYDLLPGVNEFGEEIPGASFNGIAAYVWSSTLGVPSSTGDKGNRATFATTTDPNGATITLRVYDLRGAFGETTQTIVVGEARPAKIRDLWAAITNDLLFTDDGEVTWYAIGIPAIGCARYAADTYQLAWTASGELYRVVGSTKLATLIAGPSGITAAFITWVYPETGIVGLRAWAGGSAGQVWFSPDRGLTWSQRSTVPNAAEITSISESPFLINQVFVTAGNKLYESFDGVGWTEVYAHPNTLLQASGYESGFERGFAVFKGSPPESVPSAEVPRVRERANLVAGDWNRDGSTISLAVGDWRIAYSYTAIGGETLLSPITTLTIAVPDKVIQINALGALPPGATGVNWYGSQAANGVLLRRFATGTGYAPVAFAKAAPITGQLVPTTNTTPQQLAAPTTGPTLVAADTDAAVAVDFPANANAVTLGVYEPVIYAVGLAQDNTPQSWYAPFDSSFTFKRGEYDDLLEEPFDAVRDGNIEGIIYGAAKKGIFKSVDGFRSTCYTLYALNGTSQIGRKVGFGALHDFIVKGNLVWHGAGEGNLIGTRWVYRLTDDGFSRVASPLESLPHQTEVLTPMIVLGSTIYLHAFRWSGGQPAMAANNCYKSTDGGITWALETGLQWVMAIRKGAGNTAYAVCQNSFADVTADARIYRTDDNGATWTGGAYFTKSFYNWPWAIAPHPTIANTVIWKHFGTFNLSTDGGATFTSMGINVQDQAGLGGGRHVTYTADAALMLWAREDIVPRPLKRSVPAIGATPTEVPSYVPSGQNIWLVQSEKIYHWGVDGADLSVDNGATWTSVFGSNHMPVVDTSWSLNGFVPGDTTNDWYALPYAVGGHAIWRRSATADAGDVWTNLTPLLSATFPDDDFYCFEQGAVRLSTS